MRRRYDLRNKRNFIIILILSIVIIGIFSLFIYKYKRASKILYDVPVGSVIQDINKNYINISEEAILKMRWNDTYYLIYQGNKINLGKKVIVYNTVSSNLKLYGNFYEIDMSGKVNTNQGETVLNNVADAKFYKLADREYLLVDKKITSTDRSIEAIDYLLVELDKLGNAKLSNNKINLKTIAPTTLVTSKYTFNIANEILKYGSKEIDLKRIIGSTNQYKDEEPEEDNQGQKKGNVDANATGGNGTSGNMTSNVVNNNSGRLLDISSIEEIKDKTKMTSIVRVSEGLTQIDIDYVVYDPYNEYKSVYVEVVKPSKVDVIYLSKANTHVVLDNLAVNTEYDVKFMYTTVEGENSELVSHTFDEMKLKTKMPVYDISIVKISGVSNLLTYRVDLQKNYSISNVKVNLSFDYNNSDGTGISRASIDSTLNVNSGNTVVFGNFDISDYDISNNANLLLTIDSVSGADGVLQIGKTEGYRFGRSQ